MRVAVAVLSIAPTTKRVELPVMCSPEQLVEKFGRESFHLVVSTAGGVQETPVNRKKAIANIVEILKPGGEAWLTWVQRRGETAEKEKASITSALKNYRKSVNAQVQIIHSKEYTEATAIQVRIKKRK